MIKKSLLKKISLIFVSVLTIILIYSFPTLSKNDNIVQSINFIKTNDGDIIYLLDNNNYVSRVNTLITSTEPLKKAKEIINILTINSKNSNYIQKGFSPVIPKNTKILDISLDDDLLKINFSNEFLSIEKNLENKLIESLIYSLTSMENINAIMIFVEGEHLNFLPNSKKELPLVLTRDYGINKIYELENIKGATKTTVYYLNKYLDYYYFTPVTLINNDSSNKIEIIIKELKSSNTIQTNLMSYLAANIELSNFEINEQVADLNFNNIFKELSNKEITEEVKYAISLSIKENYDVNKLNIYIDNELITTEELFNLN